MPAGRIVGFRCSGDHAVRPARPAGGANSPSDRALVVWIRLSTEAHPVWGVRREWAWLRDREDLLIKKTRAIG